MIETTSALSRLAESAKRLSAISMDPEKGLHNPFNRVNYQDTLDKAKLQMPEKLLSLYGHPLYDQLSDEQKWQLSLLETINFFSINIHGERRLVQGMEDRLYSKSRFCGSWDVSDYLQHFIHEENAHTHMLAGYCYRYGDGVMKDYAVQVADPELSPMAHELLFFGRIFVLECFLDYLNSAAMRDETIDTTVRQIHRFHHDEEARHMAFDRAMMTYCVEELTQMGNKHELETVAKLLRDYEGVALKSLYSPHVYKRIGMPNPTSLVFEARQTPHRLEVERDWLITSRIFLSKIGLCAD